MAPIVITGVPRYNELTTSFRKHNKVFEGGIYLSVERFAPVSLGPSGLAWLDDAYSTYKDTGVSEWKYMLYRLPTIVLPFTYGCTLVLTSSAQGILRAILSLRHVVLKIGKCMYS